MSRLRQTTALLAAAVALVLAPGAGPPEVTRLRVPSDRVTTWFPAGTELKGMSTTAFEKLARDAANGALAVPDEAAPRILRASHSARWEDGVLIGRSELLVEASRSGPSSVILEPWTPAIEPGSPGIRSNDSGQTFLRLAPATARDQRWTAAVSWKLRARPGTQGRKFALGLPGPGACELTLDLPASLTPEGIIGPRRGPIERDGLMRWVFAGSPGTYDLILVDRSDKGDPLGSSTLWVEGPTRVDVDESTATWTLDWSVTGGPLAPRQLALVLDPGLDLLGVSGPALDDHRAAPQPDGSTRLDVRLRAATAAGKTATRVLVRALAKVPSEGTWIVPSARPLDAIWVGGATSLRIDPSRVITSIRPLAGRRTATTSAEVSDDRRLEFEASRPGPVAQLEFHKPRIDVSAEVHGQLVVGNTSPRLSCRMIWSILHGRPINLDIDLPRSWIADRVEIEGVEDPVAWHSEELPGRGVRIHATLPSGDWADRSLVVNLSATSSIAGGRGALELPRVRPAAARVSDEVWVARVESGFTLRPTRARGIAWLDPSVALGSSAATSDGARPALAWRWTAEDADARVDRERWESASQGAVELIATIAPERLALDARVLIHSRDEAVRSITLALSEPVADPEAWRFFEAATGQELQRTPIGPIDRARTGLEGRGPSWRIDLPHPQRGRVSVAVRYEGRWEGHGLIPLLVLPSGQRARGTVLVAAGRDVRTSARAEGARALDADVTAELLAADGMITVDPAASTALRHAHAYSYDSASARLELGAQALGSSGPGGIIREAVLTTVVEPDGAPGRRRLALRVAPDHASSVEITLPPGARLDRVRRDGQSVTPSLTGDALSIPLGTVAASRPLLVITVDYTIPADGSSRTMTLEPDRPKLSMPCLSLAWDVVLPEHWEVSDCAGSLTAIEPTGSRRDDGLFDRLSFGLPVVGWNLFTRASQREVFEPTTNEMRVELAGRLIASRHEETSLGDWLTRLDAGRWPIVVDRIALAAAGWSPRSRVIPPRIDAKRPGAALDAFRSLGFSVTPVNRTWLFTSRDATRGDEVVRAEWATKLDEAVAWGSDSSDRFQSIGRWREDIVPRASTAELFELAALDEGRSVRRFLAPAWPAAGSAIRLFDRRVRAATGWGVALAVFTLGILFRGLPRGARALGTTSALALGLLALAFAPSTLRGTAAGLTGGALALVFFGLGESLPRLPRSWSNGSRSTLSFRHHERASSVVAQTLVAFVALTVTTSWALAQNRPAPDSASPILVLFPFDGPPDLSQTPDRALLRLSDYERLRACSVPTPTAPAASFWAIDARHHLGWRPESPETVLVETELTLASEGEGLAHWAFPVDDSREISAELDGTEVPVRVEPGGHSADIRVEVTAADRARERLRRLRIRRSVTQHKTPAGASISLAINPVASARVAVDSHPAGFVEELSSARGPINTGRDPGTNGLLGPAKKLDVQWSTPAGADVNGKTGAVDELLLWDVTPAGDRVRARLTYKNPGGTALVRLALEPGVIVRDSTIPGSVDVIRGQTTEHNEWLARIDPPLPDGATIMFDFFRARTDPHDDEFNIHVMPGIEPRGVERSSASLAFRRPSGWVGRIAPAAGSEQVAEEAFVRAWGGTLPDEPLTLSGAVRLALPAANAPAPQVTAGPPPARLRVQPTVTINIAPGRLALSADVELTEVAGLVHDVDVACPEGFHFVRVSADGLTDWNLTPQGLLKLRFDGPAVRQRRVHIEGWLGIAVDPLAPSPAETNPEIDLPWLRWIDQDEQPALLTISAPTRIQLVKATGSTIVATAQGPPHRMTYRVTWSDEPGRLRWEAEPPRVSVVVESQVTIDQDTADWVAVIRYDVAGGPIDAINLKVPTEWARGASVWLDGLSPQQVPESQRGTQTRGEATFWSIRPDRPIWGSQRLVVRSTAPLATGEARSFPDLSPLGWGGAVDTHLRVVNATRQPIAIDASAGLQQVASSSYSPDDELMGPLHRVGTTTRYHVVKSGWSLRVQWPGGSWSRGTHTEGTHVEHADVTCTLADDGSLLGSARYEIGPRMGPFLNVELPAGAMLLWVSMNGTPVRPANDGAGRWQIPLTADSIGRVALVWRSDPIAGPPTFSPRPIPLPIVGRGHVPTVVSVRSPAGVELFSPYGRLARTSLERIELEKASWLERGTASSLAGLDHASRRDGENLVAALVRLELLLRRGERAAGWEPDATPEARGLQASRARQTAERLRTQMNQALRSESLEDFESSARAYLGLAVESPNNRVAPTPEPSWPVQIRPLGIPHVFHGQLDSADRLPTLVWTRNPSANAADRPWRFGLVAASILLPAIVWLASRHTSRAGALDRLCLAALLALAGWLGGPLWLAAGGGLAILGRVTRDSIRQQANSRPSVPTRQCNPIDQ